MQTDTSEQKPAGQQMREDILPKEWKRIHQRRAKVEQAVAGRDDHEPDGQAEEGSAAAEQGAHEAVGRPEDLVGLGLSGGGIRSAIFNLGLLQGLSYYGVLRRIDYLSTVSGGGYIGSSMTWFGSVLKNGFPYISRDGDDGKSRAEVRKRLAHLRAHGSYLVPGDGLNLWSLIAAILAGSLTTMAVLIPVLILLVALLAQQVPGTPVEFNFFDAARWLGIGLLASFTIAVLVYGMISNLRRRSGLRKASVQRSVRRVFGLVLMYGFALVILGLIPVVYDFFSANIQKWIGMAMSSVSAAGVLSIVAGLLGAKEGSEVKTNRSSLLSLGLLLAVFGIGLWLYHMVTVQYPGILSQWAFWLTLCISAALAVLANINHVSMHRFYRNRLMEAFMPVPEVAESRLPEGKEAADLLPNDPDQCYLYQIPQTEYPYHLICTNVQTVGSESTRLRQRGGDSFVLAPEFCGSDATGYKSTLEYVGGSLNLATAMAISGAAADTNSYATRSRPLVFLMTLFNVRLGYWIRNPKYTVQTDKQWRESKPPKPSYLVHYFKSRWRPMWYWYLIREVFGRGLDENAWNIRLSDGGHFENLGLYELARRRCKLIIVSDAGRDKDFTFADLGRAVERVRADFGALIEIDLDPLRPNENGESGVPYVCGTITYMPEGDLPKETGRFIYVKSAQIDNVAPDVVAYKESHGDFPDQSTGDQFFDEEQFEAYRELGFSSARALCSRGGGQDHGAKDEDAGPLVAYRSNIP